MIRMRTWVGFGLVVFLMQTPLDASFAVPQRGARQAPKQEVIDLALESIFPNSLYKGVHRLCIDLWQYVRPMQGRDVAEEQWQQFNDDVIDSLIQLHGRVGTMVGRTQAYSPDDLEHLMELLHTMHVEYAGTVRHKKTDEVICGAVLFSRIKNRLEKILQ